MKANNNRRVVIVLTACLLTLLFAITSVYDYVKASNVNAAEGNQNSYRQEETRNDIGSNQNQLLDKNIEDAPEQIEEGGLEQAEEDRPEQVKEDVPDQVEQDAPEQVEEDVPEQIEDENITYQAAIANGWNKENHRWYYYKNYKRYSGWLSYKNKWYYLDSQDSNAMAENKVMQIGKNTYCFYADGTMAVGWAKLGGKWYFAKPGGALAFGWLQNNKKWYYLDKNSAMLLESQVFTVSGQQYYVDKSGVMRTGWIDFEKKWYYAKANGVIQKKWQMIGKTQYYFAPDTGVMCKGWKQIDGNYYYFNTSGSMRTGWSRLGGKWYFLKKTGVMVTGWQHIENQWYYFAASGEMKTGWQYISKKWYYMRSGGSMVKGWQTIGGKKYYFEEGGSCAFGWKLLNKKWYYFDTSGKMVIGWTEVGKTWYYLDSNGVMVTQWQKISNKWYYFKNTGAMTKDWQKIGGQWYYFKSNGMMVTGWQKIGGDEYYFNSSGAMASSCYVSGKYYVDSSGRYQPDVPPEAAVGSKTIKGLLLNAIQPIGKSLYILGGGHDTADATRIGINKNWVSWYNEHDATYDHKQYQYKYGYGLDCSGFVGWSIYNTLNKKSGGDYVTTTSTGAPQYYADKGWGTKTVTTDATANFKAGDIVSMEGHTWIVIGQCSDGSVVFVHATPSHTQLASTVSKSGSYNSEARELVEKYMSIYYKEVYTKFNKKISTVSKIYLKDVNRFEWKVSGGVLTDPNGYRNKSAESILVDMFGR